MNTPSQNANRHATKKVDATFVFILMFFMLLLSQTFLLAQDAIPHASRNQFTLNQKAKPSGENVQWTIGLYDGPTDAQKESLSGQATQFQISLYANMVAVPDLKRMTWKEAQVKLKSMGLVASKLESKCLDCDCVKYQKIPPGTQVQPGTNVCVSLTSRVPNVVGKTLGEAYQIMEKQNGYSMRYRSNFTSDLVVTTQNPEAGCELKRGEEVRVNCMVKVPNLKGMTIGKAKKVLLEHKLLPRLSCAHLDSDRVLTHNLAGKMVPAKTSIGLLPGVKVPNLVGCSLAEVQRRLKATGIRAEPVTQAKLTTNPGQHLAVDFVWQSIKSGDYIRRTRNLKVEAIQYVYQPPQPSIQIQRLPPVRLGFCPPCNPPNCGGGGGSIKVGGGCPPVCPAPRRQTPKVCPPVSGANCPSFR